MRENTESNRDDMKIKLKSEFQDQVKQYYNFVTSMDIKEAIQNFSSVIFFQRQKKFN
jgi:hypothetical protein